MKKVIFIIVVLGLFILNPLLAQNDSVETISSDSAQEIIETPDSLLIEEDVEAESKVKKTTYTAAKTETKKTTGADLLT